MPFIAADSYHSTIASIAGGTGKTSFDVTSAAGFPALSPGDFTIMRLDDGGTPEDIVCTGISGVTVTCLPTTIAHSNGNAIDGAILDTRALVQIKEDAISGFPVNAITGAGALVKGTAARNHITLSAAATMTLANGSYKGELCRISVDLTSIGQVTVDPASTTQWDGFTTIALFAGDVLIGAWDGTGWITLAKYSLPNPSAQKLLANNYYWATNSFGNTSSLIQPSNTTTRYAPFYVTETCTISELGTRVVSTASANFCMAIYANGPANQPSGAPLQQTGNLSTAAAALVSGALGANVQLRPGWYWLALQCDSGSVATFAGFSVGYNGYNFQMGVATLSSLSGNSSSFSTGWTSTSTYGTFSSNPTITETGLTTNSGFLGFYKVASVP